MGYIRDISGHVFDYDSRIFWEDWLPEQEAVSDYLYNSDDVL